MNPRNLDNLIAPDTLSTPHYPPMHHHNSSSVTGGQGANTTNNNGMVGALIGLNELDPEVTDQLHHFQREIDELKVETDSLRNLFRHLRGLSKEQHDKDMGVMRGEIRHVSR